MFVPIPDLFVNYHAYNTKIYMSNEEKRKND